MNMVSLVSSVEGFSRKLTTFNVVLARNMVTEVEHESCGPMKLVSPPVKYSDAKPSIRSAPPTLGQHTQEVLTLLGYEDGEVEKLRSEGVVA